MVQIHKKFSDSQVKELIKRYLRKDIERTYIQEVLGIGKTKSFALLFFFDLICLKHDRFSRFVLFQCIACFNRN